jgi:hypothetical protein
MMDAPSAVPTHPNGTMNSKVAANLWQDRYRGLVCRIMRPGHGPETL